MLFNSFAFLIFFPVVCGLYFLTPHKWRWALLLAASYYFYMNWIPTYALLIGVSTLITYFCGVLVARHRGDKKRQKIFLTASLAANLGLLVFFKYYNFLNTAVFDALTWAGLHWSVPNLDVLLPVGISFYTFQAVGYTIDVYRGDLEAERHFGIYALFVSFFPQLVAGPIERAKNLLPQFREVHRFDAAALRSGAINMLWGFFMKLCVADRLSTYVDAVFNNSGHHGGASLAVAAVFFTIQIYCDFAGYSLIALGAARVMGFRLMENFRRPFFAASIKEFWSRWHISLSTWFRDYVYIPLGGNRVPFARHLFNLFVTFVVSGLWHGANWTFLAWGAIHGFYLVVGVLLGRVRWPVRLPRWVRIPVTFVLVVVAFVFFRADSVAQAVEVIGGVFTAGGGLFVDSTVFAVGGLSLAVLAGVEAAMEWGGWLVGLWRGSRVVRYVGAVVLAVFILLAGVLEGGQFIYFQF